MADKYYVPRASDNPNLNGNTPIFSKPSGENSTGSYVSCTSCAASCFTSAQSIAQSCGGKIGRASCRERV